MTTIPVERRATPRIEINGELTYFKADSDEPHQGILENMSLQGARIWIDEKLPTASQLCFRIESEVEAVSEEFVATLLHSLPE